MPPKKKDKSPSSPFNVVIVAQNGRLGYEAALFVASLRESDPDFSGKIFLAEPQPGALWASDPRISDQDLRILLTEHLGAEFLPFENKHFGQSYPNGNKIECLLALPKGEPFVFFDTDTLITGPLSKVPFDFSSPCASLRRENTWPTQELYGPTPSEIWGALYRKFDLDFETSQDASLPKDYWRRYLYFNAGWFFYKCPHVFGQKFLDYALELQTNPPDELVCQPMHPWLDQIALPLVIHALGGGKRTIPEDTLDGAISCHYRVFPLLYARESDEVIALVEALLKDNKLKKVVKTFEPLQKMVLHGRGQKVRALFDQQDLPRRESTIRHRIKKNKLWMR